MKLSSRSLAPVIGIPAGYLPLLAMVETGPAEVAVTLFLLTALGFREAIGANPVAPETRWSRWIWSAAKIALAYSCCLLIGLGVGFGAAVIAKTGLHPTPLQRWLFGEPDLLGVSSLFVRFFHLSLCAFTCWAAAIAMMSRRRSALRLALLAAPVVFADFWLLLVAIGPAMFDGWRGPMLASILALGPLVFAVWRRPPRRRQLVPLVSTTQSVEPIELALARRKEPIQFTLGALFALVTICAVWLSLAVYSSREERRHRAMRTVPVSGTVTYEGQPLAKAQVVFYPSDPKVGKAAGGVTDGSGAFVLQTWVGGSITAPGALEGDYVVTVTKEAATAGQPDGEAPSATIPAGYTDFLHSTLRATIDKNKLNRFTFELQTEPDGSALPRRVSRCLRRQSQPNSRLSSLDHRSTLDVMSMETIQDLLHHRPFEPFEIRLSNGEVHQVRHPENVAIAKTRIAIAYPEQDRIVLCSLVHINSIEALQSA